MNDYQRAVTEKNYAAGSLIMPRDTPPAPAPSEASLAYHCHALAELGKRVDERLEAMRSLADCLVGAEPEAKSSGTLREAPRGIGGQIGEAIMAIEARLNAIAYENSRLERAIRG